MIGIGGYYGMCDDTPDIIIERDSIHPDDTDWLMLAARFLFPMYLSVGIPLNASPLRAQIARMMGKKEPTSMPFHVFWSVAILVFGATIAYLVP